MTITTKEMKRNNIYKTVLGLAMAALTLTACTDEWDDHYDDKSSSVLGGTLWDAIQQDNNLSNFASVVRACGYDKALGSSQVFTVFAPTNDCFSSSEAEALIAAYNSEKGRMDEDEISTVKEFLQNHIALYNHSVSSLSNDSIVLMNGKYAILSSGGIDKSPFLTTNQHYSNGILFTVGNQVTFFPNLFEYMRKDSELDSLYKFFYNERFYRSEFQAYESVPGGIEDGKTVYLDSVFRQQNDLFDYRFLSARLNREDSIYWMVAPTNRVWRELIEEYSNYFNYDNTVENRDSMSYTNPRLAIVKGTVFSRTNNKDVALRDSALSTNAVAGIYRSGQWGNDSLHYYQYNNPLDANGVLTGTRNVECSNGVMMISDDWKIDKKETFFQTIIIEAEGSGAIREVSKTTNTSTNEQEETITPRARRVETDNAFYNKVSKNYFVEFEPTKTTVNHSVTFNIGNVLSNIGYDIYLVTAPALANDSNATAIQRLPTILRCNLSYHDQEGATQTTQLVSSVTTQPDIVDHILLAENFKFPVCTFGMEEENTQVSLNVETRVTSTQQRNNTHTRTMRIDCIILKPHVE